jgi:hypothetical protein
MRLHFEKTQVLIADTDTNDKWIVEFTGTWQKLDAKVYKNGKYITTYSPRGGHANKTTALVIVKNVIESFKPIQP